MRRILCVSILLLALGARCLGADRLVVRDFKRMRGESVPVGAPVYDPNGGRCAMVRISVPGVGWTFEAGMWGVMDVVYDGAAVDVYLPAGTRTLKLCHPSIGRCDWLIPETLVEGAAYTAVLERVRDTAPVRPSPVKQYIPRQQTPPVPVRTQVGKPSQKTDVKHFSTEFLDFYMGFVDGESACGGLRYTHLDGRIGGYLGIGFSYDETFMLTGGVAFRLLAEDRSDFDMQWTAGVGFSDALVLETGVRFALKGGHNMSGWDLGMGLQYYDGVVIPTVEVGLLIWGIPVACALGIALGAGY